MKKTLTVNLGGMVFHIDEDAYRLLDRYLTNLRIHFNKEEGGEEIMNDFELRISEILGERVRLGNEVITIEHVENVIKRMGKVEDLFGDDSADAGAEKTTAAASATKERVSKRFFRNPDDRILGGICGGLSAYLGWDPTPVRLLLFILTFPFPVTIPTYLILWLVVPLARTATEKLQMRGESVTIESIGKAVSSNLNEYVRPERSRTPVQKFGDGVVGLLGILLKVAAVILGCLLFPPLLIVLFILVVIIFALIAGLIGGSFGCIYHLIPFADWDMLTYYPEWMTLAGGISGMLLIGIPLFSLVYFLGGRLFKYKPMPGGIRWSLLICWLIALCFGIFFCLRLGAPIWNWTHNMTIACF
jgi:phage shock protein PspC (stress-responsive transcriptional regulator)